MNEVDFIQLAPQIGKQLLGNPTKETTNEIRWGTHGSWCLNLETGLFYSFEEDQGGGVIWLIDYFNHCLLYTSPSPRDGLLSRMPSSA